MKRIGEDIQVTTRRNRPYLFKWRERIYDVRQILEFWVIQGRWWAQEERRVYFRVVVGGAGRLESVMELYRSGNRWVLSAILD